MPFGKILVSNTYIQTNLINTKTLQNMKTSECKSLLTKFFYKNEHLYFQILIQSETSTNVYGEFDDYSDYKETFDRLQSNLSSISPLKLIPERFLKSETRLAKVA
jgi:hypothetical protein